MKNFKVTIRSLDPYSSFGVSVYFFDEIAESQEIAINQARVKFNDIISKDHYVEEFLDAEVVKI